MFGKWCTAEPRLFLRPSLRKEVGILAACTRYSRGTDPAGTGFRLPPSSRPDSELWDGQLLQTLREIV